MTIVRGLLFGLVYYIITKNKKHALILGGLVISHWFLDLIVHRPDLPLTPFSEYKVGLGLWNYPIMEIIIELTLFILGIYFYYIAKQPKRKNAFWSLIAFLLIVQFMNFYGPLPPNVDAVAWGANLLWIFVIWA